MIIERTRRHLKVFENKFLIFLCQNYSYSLIKKWLNLNLSYLEMTRNETVHTAIKNMDMVSKMFQCDPARKRSLLEAPSVARDWATQHKYEVPLELSLMWDRRLELARI